MVAHDPSRRAEGANGNGNRSNTWRTLILPLLLTFAAGALGYQANDVVKRLGEHGNKLAAHDVAISTLQTQRSNDSASLAEIQADTKAMRRLLAVLADRAGVADR